MENQKIYDLLITLNKDLKNGFNRIDNQFSDVHQRIDEVHLRIEEVHLRIEEVHQRIDSLENQMLQANKETQNFINNRIRDIQFNHDYLQDKVNEIDRKVYAIGKRIEN